MKISLQKTPKSVKETDLLILALFGKDGDKKKSGSTSEKSKKNNDHEDLEKSLGDLGEDFAKSLSKVLASEGFKASVGQCFNTATLGQTKAKNIALIGLGDAHFQDIDLFRRAAGDGYRIAQQKKVKKLNFVVPKKTTVPLFDVVQALVEGMSLAAYNFGRYQTQNKKENYLKEIEILLPIEPTSEMKQAISRGQNIAEGVCLARDLVNECPMELNPEAFAKEAQKVAKDSSLAIDVLDEKKLKKENFRLMLAVASAAQPFSPPRMIRLHYKPKKSAKKVVALVGKGVTFDSGGLDIKSADNMLDMKVDMSGAAAVLGVMQVIAKLAPQVEVIGYMGCVENGVGSHAYHPGDVLFSRQGLSVEIGNTDAEGRLVLADCMDYAQEQDKPDILIDIATLTGACMVALGKKTAGIFSNDDALSDAICQSGKVCGESFWRLPLLDELKDVIKTPIADIKNVGDRWGGSITAALFLQEFVKSGTKWAHLDIAGPATNDKASSYHSQGGAGFAVRTLVDFISGL